MRTWSIQDTFVATGALTNCRYVVDSVLLADVYKWACNVNWLSQSHSLSLNMLQRLEDGVVTLSFLGTCRIFVVHKVYERWKCQTICPCQGTKGVPWVVYLPMAKEKLHAPPDASHAVYPTHQLHVTCSESIIDHEIIFCVYISDSIWFSLFDTYLLKGSRRSLSLLQRALPPAKQKIHMVGGLPSLIHPSYACCYWFH